MNPRNGQGNNPDRFSATPEVPASAMTVAQASLVLSGLCLLGGFFRSPLPLSAQAPPKQAVVETSAGTFVLEGVLVVSAAQPADYKVPKPK